MNKSGLLFYEIMNYPIPINWEYFSTEKKNNIDIQTGSQKFSREREDPLLNEYREHIIKHEKIFKSLPWIKTIYICNSLSFNKLNSSSDIDLFIITKEGYLRRTRFISAFIFLILGLKRNKTNTIKKYCLSFYITESAKNLYTISLQNTDIYLAYRLAHLIPIYQDSTEKKSIYKHNQRIYGLLPNLPKNHHAINIGLPIFKGKTKFKGIAEKYISGIFGRIVEYMIKMLRVPILIYKTKKLQEVGKDIIFNDNMLKFHKDKRKKISLLYRTRSTRG